MTYSLLAYKCDEIFPCQINKPIIDIAGLEFPKDIAEKHDSKVRTRSQVEKVDPVLSKNQSVEESTDEESKEE